MKQPKKDNKQDKSTYGYCNWFNDKPVSIFNFEKNTKKWLEEKAERLSVLTDLQELIKQALLSQRQQLIKEVEGLGAGYTVIEYSPKAEKSETHNLISKEEVIKILQK